MATIEDFQRDLSNTSLVTTFATHATPVEVEVTKKGKDGKPIPSKVMVLKEQPVTLAAQAGIRSEDVDDYSLARLLKSEGYSGPVSEKARALVAIGQAVINHARAKFGSNPFAITRLLTSSVYKAANGLYGEQSGRYAATSADPRPYHLKLAKALRRGELPNIVGEAEYFLDPWGPGAEQRGKKLQPFDEVLQHWHDVYKYARQAVQGLSPMALLVFRDEPDPTVRAKSLNETIALWRDAYAGGARGSEGQLAGPSTVRKMVPVNIATDDYAGTLAAQNNYAVKTFGLTPVNFGKGQENRFYPSASGTFIGDMIRYWIPETQKALIHADDIPDSAIRSQWINDVKKFGIDAMGLIPIAAQAGDKNVSDATAVLFWQAIDKVVTPMGAIRGTPTKFTILLESIEEAIEDLGNKVASGASSGLENLMKFAVIGLGIWGGVKILEVVKK